MNLTSLKVGDQVVTNIGTLTLTERVREDRSMLQWEPGWWAEDADGKEYFLGMDGQVYNNSDQHPHVWDVDFGKVTAALV